MDMMTALEECLNALVCLGHDGTHITDCFLCHAACSARTALAHYRMNSGSAGGAGYQITTTIPHAIVGVSTGSLALKKEE